MNPKFERSTTAVEELLLYVWSRRKVLTYE